MSDPRSRVLVVSRSYPSDLLPILGLWVERPTQLLAEYCDVRVLSLVPWCPPLPAVGPLRQYVRFRRIPRHERRAGIEVERPRFLAGPGRSLHPLEVMAQERGARRSVEQMRAEFSFDLIHAHMIHPEGAVAHRLSQRYGVPFVVSEHAPWTTEWFRSRRVRNEALAAAHAAAALLPVSSSVRETMRSFGVEGDRVRVVPVGVDGQLFRPGRAEDRIHDRILYVGWINYTKGIDVLLRAMNILRSRGERGRLLLVGGAAYRHTRLQEEEIRRLADELDLGDRVSFAGPKPHEEVARLMAESAVIVLPSRAESFGATLIEALASGTPVVATACGGPEDIVTDEVGRLVSNEDPRALADALASVLSDPRRFTPAALRAYALERFGWEKIVPEIAGEYRRVLGQHSATGVGQVVPLSGARA